MTFARLPKCRFSPADAGESCNFVCACVFCFTSEMMCGKMLRCPDKVAIELDCPSVRCVHIRLNYKNNGRIEEVRRQHHLVPILNLRKFGYIDLCGKLGGGERDSSQ